jgi:hypothetical protein
MFFRKDLELVAANCRTRLISKKVLCKVELIEVCPKLVLERLPISINLHELSYTINTLRHDDLSAEPGGLML